ncbi:MAG TPA: hypothetical protein VNO81_05355 [Candidatus Nitrosotenuis sp.]|nr:hypothetical protein [Candidatus Nitrosotenuis sp.]
MFGGFSFLSSLPAIGGAFPMGVSPSVFSSFLQLGGMAGSLLGGPVPFGGWEQLSSGMGSLTMAGSASGYLGVGANAQAGGMYRQPIYRDRYSLEPVYCYETQKAWYYEFQQGLQTHEVESSASVAVRELPRPRDPVILDLNGDGRIGVTGRDDSREILNEQVRVSADVRREGWSEITTTTTTREYDLRVNWNKKIDFDVDGDGDLDRTEWLARGGGDGLLVMDVDGDGKINGRELMNETGIQGEQNKYKDGWEKARDLFDADKDGLLKGEELKKLKVWCDENGDGVTDPGELKSLDSLGIVCIDTVNGSFTRKVLAGYKQVHHREEIGYYEMGAFGWNANSYGVGSRLVLGGKTLHNFQIGNWAWV